jgi:hypothetical protein
MQLSGCARSPPVIDSRSPSADVFHCTSRQPKAHSTESRVVLYPWHPWHQRTVYVFSASARGIQRVLRCALESTDVTRALEIPQWMFDPVACTAMTMRESPRVDVVALRALVNVLRSASVAAAPVLQAGHQPQPGGAHATEDLAPQRSVDAVSSTTDPTGLGKSAGGGSSSGTAPARAILATSLSGSIARAGGAR